MRKLSTINRNKQIVADFEGGMLIQVIAGKYHLVENYAGRIVGESVKRRRGRPPYKRLSALEQIAEAQADIDHYISNKATTENFTVNRPLADGRTLTVTRRDDVLAWYIGGELVSVEDALGSPFENHADALEFYEALIDRLNKKPSKPKSKWEQLLDWFSGIRFTYFA